eukprot:1025706-Pelagomonas_calceolata.AAC.1
MDSINHIALRCPQHTQFQHLISSAPPSNATRLRDSMKQADVLGLAKLDCFGYRHISASAKLPPAGGYSFVSLSFQRKGSSFPSLDVLTNNE